MKKFFALTLVTLLAGSTLLHAQVLLDETRLQAVVAQQSPVLVRVKAAVDDPAVVKATDAKEPANKDAAKEAKDTGGKEEARTALRLGTGFFVSGNGLIITNASVVHQAKRVWYEYNGIPYLAEVKGIDVPTNVALLQAKTMPPHISSLNLTDNVSLPGTGALMIRLSLPMEFGPTPTIGIVQGADSQFGVKAFPTRYLRVQLNTGPGEAGAPVFDLQGRFVGMTVAVLPELGATYVLPARALSWVRDGMQAGNGTLAYSYFGFNADEERSTLEGLRIIVRDVQSDGPALPAGLKAGDVIVEAAHKPIASLSDLRDAAFFTKPGQYLDLKVKRGDKEIPVAIQAQGRTS